MIKLGMQVPQDAVMAVSGGADSMAALDFLTNRRHPVAAAYFNHGTQHGSEAEVFVREFCRGRGITLYVGQLNGERVAGQSPEEFWRNQRYGWLESLGKTIVTAHHLDDNIEQWIFSSLHGKPGTIPVRRNCVIRPFMLTERAELRDWCTRRQVPWIEDPSNSDTHYIRNHIRHNLMPQALIVNPGLAKVVGKLVRASYSIASA